MVQPVIFVLMNCLPKDVLHVDRTVVLASVAGARTFVITHLSGIFLQCNCKMKTVLNHTLHVPSFNTLFYKLGNSIQFTHIFGISMQNEDSESVSQEH